MRVLREPLECKCAPTAIPGKPLPFNVTLPLIVLVLVFCVGFWAWTARQATNNQPTILRAEEIIVSTLFQGGGAMITKSVGFVFGNHALHKSEFLEESFS